MEPFEVMISESQERMCAVVGRSAGRTSRGVRALGPAGRGHRRGHRRRRHRGRRRRDERRPRARPDPGARADERRDRPRAGRAPPPRRGAPAPGAPADAVDALPERGMDPGAVLLALLGSPNLARAARVPAVRLDGQANTVAGPGTAPRSCASRARPRRSSPRPTATQAVGALDPWLGAALSSRRRRATSRSPAPGRSASRTASTTATRPGPRRSGS
jgi:hypothetical protein